MRRLTEGERKVQMEADLALVRRALDGQREARAELMQRMHFVPRALAAKNAEFGRPLGTSELEDLAQDVLVALWRKLGDYAGTGTLEAWIYRFCLLQWLGHMRRRKRGPSLFEDVALDPGDISDAPLRASLDNERIYAALEDMGPPESDILRLKHLEDLTFDEIGRRLEVPSSTIKSRYYRGLKQMRQLLGQGMSPVVGD